MSKETAGESLSQLDDGCLFGFFYLYAPSDTPGPQGGRRLDRKSKTQSGQITTVVGQ